MSIQTHEMRSVCLLRKRAFTIVELLVVTAMISVLVTLLVPAVNLARESSRKAACQSNLRQFGLGMMAYAQNHQGRYCSGAFDWKLDGAVTEKGWVADLVNQGIPVGKMLCPSNSAVIAETYNDLLAGDVSASPCVDRLGSRSRALPDGTEEVNPCRQIIAAGLEPRSDARRSLVQQQVLEKFYNTNYAASWLLVRSRPLLDASGNLVSRQPGCSSSIDSQSATAGPLTETMLDTAKVPASNVPLLGCGRTTGSLVQDLSEIPAGSFTAQAFTSGPVHVTTGQPPKFPSAAPRDGPNGWWAVWSRQTVQDYRGFAPVHREACNILMADGSVRAFQDVNGDGILHNGFPPSASGGNGGDETLELPASELFSGATLRSL